jgi:hypothetical protein
MKEHTTSALINATVERGMCAALVVVLALACSSATDTAPKSEDLEVTLESGSGTLFTGSTAEITVSVKRLRGYAGTVTLSAEDLPSGVTATFGPPTQMPSGVTRTALTLSATASAPVGPTVFTIRASGVDVVSATATAEISIRSTTLSDFSLSIDQAAIILNRNATTAVTITIDRRGGFNEAVLFSVTGLPAGLTATVVPTVAAGNSAIMTISVGSNVLLGGYTGTVLGEASSAPQQTARFTISVTM